MRTCFSRFVACRRGIAAVELALSVPILMALIVGLIEIGRVLSQANAVERGLRAGTMYAARAPAIDSGTIQAVQNLVIRGTVDNSGTVLVPDWNTAPPIVTVVQERMYTTTLDSIDVPVIRVTATVPYVSVLPGLLPNFTFTRWHEQAFIGQ